MSGPLEGRSAIVTGGTRGIGKGIARALLRDGCSVMVVGRSDYDPITSGLTADSSDAQVVFCRGDVGVAADRERIVSSAVSLFDGLDILCCNAGVFAEVSLDQMDEGTLREIISVNLMGSILMASTALPALRRSTHGRIILTSSITGAITGVPGFTHYAATKAGQLGFMRGAAVELAPSGITVNAVLPGNIETEGLLELGLESRQSIERSIPLGHLGSVDDVGAAVAYLASDRAAFVTGHALVIDGGQILPES